MTKKLTKYDDEKLIGEFSDFLKEQYGDAAGLEKFQKFLKKRSREPLPESVPLSIFSDKLSPFETIVKYLAENLKKGYSEIGQLLGKDRQVIWTTYRRASDKQPARFTGPFECDSIPVSRLYSERHSMAELIVGYLKDELGMKNSQVSELIKKDQRTIWTLYSRYKKKNE